MKLIEFTKICTKCGTRKNWLKFQKHKGCRFGISPECTICHNKRGMLWKRKNPEKVLKDRRKWYKNNPEYNNKYYKENFTRIIENSYKWAKENPEKVLEFSRKHRRENLEKCQKNAREFARKQYKDNPKMKLNHNMRTSIWRALKSNKNGCHWETLVGYTLGKLKRHLEKQFVEGMTWENYGEWHVDHKIPVSVFNFTKPEHNDFLKCFALCNLQPLWAKDNLSKQAKLNKPFQPSLLI